ncbi:MAG: hypothetical protein Q7S56_00950 [Nanoarchaeota archaeon]|nr:hypothetical protein [Nanoarchaeota archaeon]
MENVGENVEKAIENVEEIVEKAVESAGEVAKKEINKEIKKHPKRSTLTFILLFTLIIAFIGALAQQNWGTMIFIFVISLLIFLPLTIGKLSKIDIPSQLEVFAVLFIYATLFLGELQNYYATYWWWDILWHTSSGLAFGILGFFILYVLYKAEKIKTSPKVVAMFTFTFALSIGALWEIVEFTIDHTLGPISNNVFMQGSLVDTMYDLIVDSVGGLFSAVMGYLYLKKDSGIVVKSMTKELKKDNPGLFNKKTKKEQKDKRP